MEGAAFAVKPSPFGYSRPESLEQTVALLGRYSSEAKVLAGGQSLLPLLSMRLAAPRQLIDINRVRELAYIRTDGDAVRVGALVRQADVERDDAVAAVQPLLPQALRLVAHPTIRNRGTVAGSLAHADPAGELTAVLAVLGGAVRLVSVRGGRTVPAAEFFTGPLSTSAAADELVVEAIFPGRRPHSGSAFVEVSAGTATTQSAARPCASPSAMTASCERRGRGSSPSARRPWSSSSATPWRAPTSAGISQPSATPPTRP